MSNHASGFVVAERGNPYQSGISSFRWLEVLVDCPGVQGLFTYRLSAELSVQAGDIVSVPFGTQITGGIAIRLVDTLPPDLDPDRIREVEDIISTGFFPPSYWELLHRVAQYYCTDLMSVIRAALPPGLLGRSGRRIRLNREVIPAGAETFCSVTAAQILRLLKGQKEGDYSDKYLKGKVRGAQRGIRELIKRGWVESYLEHPRYVQPQLKKAVTLTSEGFSVELTQRQQEILQILRNHGGEMWLSDCLQICRTTANTLKGLEEKGYLVLQEQEVLRREQGIDTGTDEAKVLTSAQAQALKTLQNVSGFASILLHGVTGSGKTEVYLQAIAPLLEAGKSALILVPEIGLTPQLTDRFRARFGQKVCVYHSALSEGERYDTWRSLMQGDPQVVIGTRSALFAPLPNLGLIVLDEEHDSSFKQTQIVPTYHARTVAQWRAELENCPLILGSATPSLESWVNVRSQLLVDSGKKDSIDNPQLTTNKIYLSLPERIQSRPLPPVEIVDMRQELQRGNRSMFSLSLREALQTMQAQKQQGIIFVPRRGHSTFVSCRSCGYVLECPHCDVSLSYHYTHEGATELLRCHYCNYSRLQPRICPECDSPYLKFFGSGTQKVVQELAKEFPQLRSLRFDSDTTRSKGSHRALLTQFANAQADLLVGTQMLTKGIDLAQVTLVAVIAADGLLYQSDYRAAERTFQTLTQVAGRAGRGDEAGRVIIQTYNPEHSVIQAVQQHNYAQFVETELSQRQALGYPPYGRLILIRLSGLDAVEVQNTSQVIADACRTLMDSQGEILGPAPATIMKMARRYRWHLLLKFPADSVPLIDFSGLRSLCPPSVSMTLDIDPLYID